jgi:hypothetical protein
MFTLKPKVEPHIIQGQEAQSINEWNVWLALIKLKLADDTIYQYIVDGGRAVRGGQVVDFVVFGPGRPTAIMVQGAYWHKGSTKTEDTIKHDRLEQLGFYVVDIEEQESDTPEAALVAVKKAVG